MTRAASASATRCDLEALKQGEIIKLLVTRELDLILCLLASHSRLPLARRSDDEPIAEGQDRQRRRTKFRQQKRQEGGEDGPSLWPGEQGRRIFVPGRQEVDEGWGGACLAAGAACFKPEGIEHVHVLRCCAPAASGPPPRPAPMPTAHCARPGRSVGPSSAGLCKEKR